MKIFVIILSVFLCVNGVQVHAQYDIELQVSDIQIKVDNEAAKSVESCAVQLKDRAWSQWQTLYKAEGIVMYARYRIKGWNSKISAHKDAGVTMRIEYACERNGRMERIKVIRSFFAGDSRFFKEKQTFHFSKGLYNNKVDLSYSGSLPT